MSARVELLEQPFPPEFARLRGHFDEPQAYETIQLVAFHHGVSLFCGALDLPPEAGAARFPTA